MRGQEKSQPVHRAVKVAMACLEQCRSLSVVVFRTLAELTVVLVALEQLYQGCC